MSWVPNSHVPVVSYSDDWNTCNTFIGKVCLGQTNGHSQTIAIPQSDEFGEHNYGISIVVNSGQLAHLVDELNRTHRLTGIDHVRWREIPRSIFS